MHGAVIPALPAIRVPDLLGPATAQFSQQKSRLAVRPLYQFAFSMSVSLGENRPGSVLFTYPLYLGGDNIGGLIPGDPLIFAFTPVLRVSFPVGSQSTLFKGYFIRLGE